mmetsp:Transcript_50873/g.162814  ORF Transcript_50873/g.162814 Transcript_50873/m.162814 type:complete len:293 (+) Transcript_50873:2640-3518(+)
MTFTAQGDTTAFMLPGDAPTQCPRAGEATQMFSSPGAGVGERPFSVGAGCERPWLGLFVSRSVKALLMPQDRGAGGPEVQATPRHRSSVSRPSTASTCTASSSLGVATPETRASRGPEPEPVSSGGEVPGSLRTCGTVLGEPPREEPTKTRGGEAEAEAAGGGVGPSGGSARSAIAKDIKDFEYLVGMPISSLTAERVEELMRQHQIKNTELDALRKKTPARLWVEDLDELERVLDERDAAIAEADRLEQSKIQKARAKLEKSAGKGAGRRGTKRTASNPAEPEARGRRQRG